MTAEQLRNSILQEAISGRLVPQDPNDELASALLARIREEKARLVKEGKLKKKDLVETPITDEEKPFEIPSSWEWVKISNLVVLLSGRDLEPSHYNSVSEGIAYITGASCIEKGHIIVNRWTKTPVVISKCGDLLISCKGTIGKIAINNIGDCHIARQIMAIRLICGELLYVRYFIETLTSELKRNAVSMIPGISREDILNSIFPLPPLAEQKRIVAKLEELLPIVEQYGKAQKELDELNAALPARLRQSILQEAISGRLVPQDPNDEPIAKILNTFGVKTIESEEDIPAGWSRIRMGEATEFINGLAFKPEEWKEAGLPIVRIQNLSNPHQPLHYTDKEIPEKFIIDDGQLLFSWSATLDAFIWNRGKACLNQHIFKLVPQPFIDKIYLYYLLKAIVEEYKKVTHGSTMKHITKGIFENYEILLPPLAEQQRIVAKIEELLADINKISK